MKIHLVVTFKDHGKTRRTGEVLCKAEPATADNATDSRVSLKNYVRHGKACEDCARATGLL